MNDHVGSQQPCEYVHQHIVRIHHPKELLISYDHQKALLESKIGLRIRGVYESYLSIKSGFQRVFVDWNFHWIKNK